MNSPYFMCHCAEHKLSALQVRISEETPALLFPRMLNTRHFLVEFWKWQKAVPILPHDAKAPLELFCLQPIVFG